MHSCDPCFVELKLERECMSAYRVVLARLEPNIWIAMNEYGFKLVHTIHDYTKKVESVDSKP